MFSIFLGLGHVVQNAFNGILLVTLYRTSANFFFINITSFTFSNVLTFFLDVFYIYAVEPPSNLWLLYSQKGNTALHIASLAGQLNVVNLLIEHGAKVNIQSQVSNTGNK